MKDYHFFEKVKEIKAEKNLDGIELQVNAKNKAAYEMYCNYGFTENQKTLLPRTVSTSASPAHSVSASIGVRCPICRLWHRSFRISCWRKSWSWMQK